MAKYTVSMSCGHKDTVELFGKDTERQRKIEYFEQYGLCKECFKEQARKREESEPLAFHASTMPYINEKNGEVQIYIWLSGNSRERKEDIKKLGYHWSERTASADVLSMKSPGFCWNKVIDQKDLSAEAEKAKSLGIEHVTAESDIYSMANYNIAMGEQKAWRDTHDKIDAIPKPAVPDILIGRKWNQKIYGKAGNYSIYPDGEKTLISDEQAEEIREYLVQKEEYKKQVEAVK